TLRAGGSTNMEAGLSLGYQQIAQHQHDEGVEGRSSRLMIFTDAQPNTGRTDTGSFIGQVKRAANQGIGFTAFGVGLDFSASLIDVIANLRGGNYFFLADSEAIQTIFDKDFEYLVTPLAYDLKLELRIPSGFRFVAAHGVKAWKTGCTTSTIEVPTIFLSRNKGAMLVELERDGGPLPPTAEIPVLSGILSYTMPDGKAITGRMAIGLPETAFTSQGAVYSQPAVRRVVALVSEVEGMKEACRRYWTQQDPAGARALLLQIEKLLLDHQTALMDSSLTNEIALVEKLRDNMK
ncbi:MAG: VWA domain-containing protein, partial [Deltaproteobacteria bacterium]|nr:VWA domain-containing protein [Deltaproteobacteria bacterium]